MVLIVGATLLVGTLVRLYAVDRGFEGTGVLIVSLRSGRPYTDERAKAVKHALIERLRAVPGIRAASATRVLPVSGDLWTKAIQVEGSILSWNGWCATSIRHCTSARPTRTRRWSIGRW